MHYRQGHTSPGRTCRFNFQQGFSRGKLSFGNGDGFRLLFVYGKQSIHGVISNIDLPSDLAGLRLENVVTDAFKQAVRWQLTIRNPIDAVDPPRVERKEMKVLEEFRYRILLHHKLRRF